MCNNELDRFTVHGDGNDSSALPGLSVGHGSGRACGSTGVGMGYGVEWWSGIPLVFHGRGVACGRGFSVCAGGNRLYPSDHVDSY